MKVTIEKYDPAVDIAPHTESYDVPYQEHMSALEALVYIHENCEDVAFDYSCHGRACGRCAMMIDGEPALACITPLDDGDHAIEPLKGFTVIRDLIVDKSSFATKLGKTYNRVITEPVDSEKAELCGMEHHDKMHGLEWCCRCGICMSTCPALEANGAAYAGPAHMVAEAYRFYDPYDQGDRVVEAVMDGLYHCILCGKCDEVCPEKEVAHLDAYATLRDAAEKRDLKPSYAR